MNNPKRKLPLPILLMISLLPSAGWTSIPPAQTIIGTWRFVRVLDSAEITFMDGRAAAKLVGKTVQVTANAVSIAGENCGKADLTLQRHASAAYVRSQYHAPVGRLGLPETVSVIDLGCTEAFFKSPRRAVIFWNGYFFDAVRR